MIRRLALVGCAVLAAASFSSCSTFSDNDAVARVGGVELSRDTVEGYVSAVLEAQASASGSPAPTTVGSDQMRGFIGSWIVNELVRQKLDSTDISITDEDLATARTTVLDQNESNGVTLPTNVVEFDANGLAARTVFEARAEPGALGPFAAATKITVDPVYGYFDLPSGSVLPLGG